MPEPFDKSFNLSTLTVALVDLELGVLGKNYVIPQISFPYRFNLDES